MRLGVVVPSLMQGGGVPAVARFIKNAALRSGNFELKMVSLSTSADDPESLRMAAPSSWMRGVATRSGFWDGLPFVHVGAMGGEFEFQRYRPRKALAEMLSGCDVIQVVCGAPAWANAVIGLGKPVAMHVATRTRVERRLRDTNPYGPLQWWRKAMTGIADHLDDEALRRVDAIQVMNPWMLEYARKINVQRNVDLRYAPPGIDAGLFRPVERQAATTDPYVLCVGRFGDPRKNIGLLLEAYAQLPEVLRDQARLVLAGASEPPHAFWSRARALGVRERISYIKKPDLDALIRLYQGATVFASPSDEEGFGMVLLEAMACGIPVVATCSGGPDGIITDGEDGYLVPLNDTPALSSRLHQLLRNPALNVQMGRKARSTVDRRYDERIAGDVFIDVWERLVRKVGGIGCAS